MANAGHHGHRTSRHRAGKLLVIKGHEVLKGAAAAHQQNTVGRRRNGSGAAQAINELGRRTLALNLGAHADKLDERVATRSVRLTSSITAPESEVTTATREQNTGMRRLRDSSISPSRRSFSANCATC